jgi:chitinase
MSRNLLLLITCSLLASRLQSQHKPAKPEFRIVGYYSMKAAMSADLATLPFNKLTHINLYFLNPDSLGKFHDTLSQLRPFIEAAHASHVKVLPSIAGGGKHPYYRRLLMDDKRGKLISDLLSIVLENDFDGIDVDLEGSDIDENYENFAVELAAALKPHKKLVTSAIAVFYKDVLSDKALAQYDFLNVMSYDHTGPWTPSKPGPHSTYEHAVSDLDYFATTRKIPKSKLVLGVGFYGYGFGPTLESTPSSMNFSDILATYPGSENADEFRMPGGATMYYNGIATIKKKTQLAKEKASGIMIWQLQGDAPAEKSLLNVIYDEAHGKK